MKTLHQKVFLIRHGETEWTQSKQHTGRTDIPLTDLGRAQAKLLKTRLEGLHVKKVFCSPLARAKETCELAGFLDHAKMDEDLFEWDYGDYEGKTSKEIHEIDPKWTIFSKGAPNGESIGDVSTRAQRMLGKIIGVEGDVLIFSSGHFLRALGAKWLHLPITDGKLFVLATASISILGYESGTPVFIQWNERIPSR